MNKKMKILTSLMILGVIVIFFFLLFKPIEVIEVVTSMPTEIEKSPSPSSTISITSFKIIDSKTNKPLSEKEIVVCDDSIKFGMEIRKNDDTPYNFCAYQNIWLKTKTDKDGVISIDLNKILINPRTNIVLDLDKSGTIFFSRSDKTDYTYNPDYIRFINKDSSGTVISNLFYNLKTKEVREVFLKDRNDEVKKFDIITFTI